MTRCKKVITPLVLSTFNLLFFLHSLHPQPFRRADITIESIKLGELIYARRSHS